MRDGEVKMVSIGDPTLACHFCTNTGKNHPELRFALIEFDKTAEYLTTCEPCFNVKFLPLPQGN